MPSRRRCIAHGSRARSGAIARADLIWGFVRPTSFSKHRLELLTDAVLAIVMTIMVLDLRTPLSSGPAGWIEIGPSLLLYVIGFVLVVMGIIIHHDYCAHFREIGRAMLWGNFVFVFFVTLVPLLLRAIAAHPGDSFNVAVLPVDVLIAGLGLTTMRIGAVGKHRHDPGFQDWYRHRRRNSLWAAPLLVLAAGLAYVSVYVTLGMFAIFAIGFIATF